MRRGRLAWLFLALVVLGILWPVVAGAVSCGDCCEGRTGTCGTPAATGFSLCCFHSASTLPDPPLSGFAPVYSSRLTPTDEIGAPPPCPRDILHVPRALLT
ncbi:MAG TPA: hypothetical protein VF756_11010 [Thermoanaerobaculia bacterium]